jgi:hypothetical protein
VVVLMALMLTILLACIAFGVDIGMLVLARTQLQRAADSAALAGACELLKQKQEEAPPGEQHLAARQTAVSYGGKNQVCSTAPSVDLNMGNFPQGDVVIGYTTNPRNRYEALSLTNPAAANAVRVRIRHPAPTFFARIFGLESLDVTAEGTAAFLVSFRGFRPPENENLPLLPFTLKKSAWDEVLSGQGPDAWQWDSDAAQVRPGQDAMPEINLFPWDTGAGGCSGSIDIGSNNSTAPKLRRQLTEGVTAEDLSFHGGQLSLDYQGELDLSVSNDPGLKVGVIDAALKASVGRAYIVPLYSQVSGTGQNARYTIVGFAAARIVDVNLKGHDKHVLIQPAHLLVKGGISDDGGGASSNIYSPVILSQ